MNDNIAYADGWNINLGKEAYENLEITITVDGKYYARTNCEPSVVDERYYGKEFAAKVKNDGGYAILAQKVLLKKEIYDNVMAAIAEATAEAGRDVEYTAHNEAKKATEEATKKAKQSRMDEFLCQAKATGEKVLIKQWMEDCNDKNMECSTDVVYEWMMPDGSTKTTRQHTF
jgi:hypothetical protein